MLKQQEGRTQLPSGTAEQCPPASQQNGVLACCNKLLRGMMPHGKAPEWLPKRQHPPSPPGSAAVQPAEGAMMHLCGVRLPHKCSLKLRPAAG